jgi:chitinase
MALLCLLSGIMFAQSEPPETSQPIDATGGFLQREGAQPKFEGASKLSSDARAAMREARIFSVPHFSGSFESQEKAYSFTMVGKKPQSNATTKIPVQIIPISLFFEEFVDEKGAAIVLDPGAIVPRVQSSPNFHDAQYATGTTQFADAVQRAQFNAIAGNWHTLLGAPQFLKPLRIAVPRGDAQVYRNPSTGVVYAIVDTDFFLSQLNTVIQMANLSPDALAIALTQNVFLAPQKDIKKCCVLGFHTSF